MEVSYLLRASGALSPRNEPGTHWTGGWVGPKADLDIMVKRKILPV
jgi:hypothetical protein